MQLYRETCTIVSPMYIVFLILSQNTLFPQLSLFIKRFWFKIDISGLFQNLLNEKLRLMFCVL